MLLKTKKNERHKIDIRKKIEANYHWDQEVWPFTFYQDLSVGKNSA